MPIIFNPNSKLQPVFVRDVATGFTQILDEAYQTNGKIYEFGGPDVFDWGTFVPKAASEYGLYGGTIKPIPPFVGK